MLDFLAEYGIFLAKAVTIVAAILFVVIGVASAGSRGKKHTGKLEVKKLNDEIQEFKSALEHAVLSKEALKQLQKDEKQKEKQKAKEKKQKKNEPIEDAETKRVYVLNFDGDIKASAVNHLREEITAVLSIAKASDEVVVRLESGGGMVHSYGLAASQLRRVRDKGIPLVACVDKVAASGGYMMACVADKVCAAPFAVIGSIGVVAQLPNFHRVLKKNDIDFEMFTAGDYKRTVTMFGENTEKGREKFQSDLEETHDLFKNFVKDQRPTIDIDTVANGDVWYGSLAKNKGLVDEIVTSDEYLTRLVDEAELFEVSFKAKQTIQDKLGHMLQASIDRLILTWIDRINKSRFFS